MVRSAQFLAVEPIAFSPIYMTRVWGGRSLDTIYQRNLPDNQPYGESWEISDRPNEQSIVSSGFHVGKSLHDLWTNHREEIFGKGLTGDRFPLLIKILDARDDLSIQVHPPAEIAGELGGEPKTEMWYIADCDPGAKLYIGLKNGSTRESFEQSLLDGTVEKQVHAVRPKAGESIFIPSGRLHAIGAGFLIYEIQQNSDTTYRVFDWNRVGLDGTPRDLHVEESMTSINSNLEWMNRMATPWLLASILWSSVIVFRNLVKSQIQTIHSQLSPSYQVNFAPTTEIFSKPATSSSYRETAHPSPLKPIAKFCERAFPATRRIQGYPE